MRKLKLDELNRLSIEEYRKVQKIPVTVILDNIRSGMNVGSVFRTSDAFAVKKIVLCGITATPPHREINKTAIGATQSVEWEYEKDVSEAIQKLKKEGTRIFAVEQTVASTLLHKVDLCPSDQIVLIFGNEVNGVSDEALELVEGSIEIPQYGTKHSFNIAVSAGIVLWHIAQFFKRQP